MTQKRFEEDPEIKAQVDTVEALVIGKGRGDVIEWEAIEQALGLKRDEPRCIYVVKKVRRNLHRDRKIETWPVPGLGIKLLTHLEQVTLVPDRRGKKAYRQHGLILRSVQNTEIAQLPMHARKMAAAVVEHSQQARKESRKVRQVATSNVTSDRQRLLKRPQPDSAGA